jgi:transposase
MIESGDSHNGTNMIQAPHWEADQHGCPSRIRATCVHAWLRRLLKGATREEAAERFGVSLSSVGRFLRLERETGSVSSAKFGGCKPYALAAHEERVRQLMTAQPDITLASRPNWPSRRSRAQTSIFRFLRHLNLTSKKSLHASRYIATRSYAAFYHPGASVYHHVPQTG